MKIRQGFVSNSSSSSFIIIGKEINILDVKFNILKEKEIIALGKSLNDGQDVFKVKTVEQLAFLKALKKIGNDDFIFFDSCAFDSDSYSGELKNIPQDGKLKYYTGEKDYHSSESINDLKYRYDEYDETKLEMQIFLRSKKIKKIEDNINLNK